MSSPSADDVLRTMPAGLMVVDRAGDVVRINPAGQRILGVDALAVGHPVARLLAPLDTLIGGRLPHRRHRLSFLRPDGSRGQLCFTAGPADGDHWVVVFQDVTQWDDEQWVRDDLLKIETVDEVLPSLLHELRNPLAAITSAVELLIEETPPGELRTELEAILVEGRRMDLSFQGMGAVGRSLRSTRPQPVASAVREVVRVMRASAARAGVILRLDCPPMPRLYLNAAVVRAVLYNLINNAITACREGDEIRVSARVSDDGAVAQIVVHDTGIGMAPEVLARCTDLFFTTRSHGSGMGLSMCRRAVEEADGSFSVLSTAGRGTRVVIEVPVGDPAAAGGDPEDG